MELAMLRAPDGTPIPRTEARQSFFKGLVALAAAGGQPPRGPDGSPMLWNEKRGWFPRAKNEGTARRAGRPLAELLARQNFRDHQRRQDRLDQAIRVDHPLLRGASPLAWCWARLFRHGLSPQPHLDAPAAELIGWRLARRGYDRPPAWLLQERRDASRNR